jgi:RNA polymerase sigma-70 factor (TIGR02943 family)
MTERRYVRNGFVPTDDKTTASRIENADRWLDEHGDCLYRYALVRVRAVDVAQDLVQDTFLAALQSYNSFAGKASERTWLCGILKNKIVDYYRKLGRETSFTDLESLSDEFSEKFTDGGWVHLDGPKNWKPQADVVKYRAEFWETMRKCLGKLPDSHATVFMLREMEEFRTEEICTLLRISETNLSVMLHRARMAMRECLEVNWFEKRKK